MNSKLTLAIQKKGRLSDESISLLKKSGLIFEITERSLNVSVKNFDLEILLLRSSDIPEIVANRIADIGIVGQNTVAEKGYSVTEREKLGFGACSLCIAYPEAENSKSLEGKRVATSYPSLLKKYFDQKNITATAISFSGSVELAPKLNIADCICDLVSTGSTLKSNGLTKGECIFESQAVLIQGKNIKPEKTLLLEKLLLRIRAVLAAKQCKYIVMNARKSDLEKIQTCVPGLKRPTVSPLSDTNYVSIASVVEEDAFWLTIEKLKESGASDILVLPIEKMIL